jgi:hypothetical protein
MLHGDEAMPYLMEIRLLAELQIFNRSCLSPPEKQAVFM